MAQAVDILLDLYFPSPDSKTSAALESNRPLQSLIQRRIDREPLQYIIGSLFYLLLICMLRPLRNPAFRPTSLENTSSSADTPPRDRELGHQPLGISYQVFLSFAFPSSVPPRPRHGNWLYSSSAVPPVAKKKSRCHRRRHFPRGRRPGKCQRRNMWNFTFFI